MMERDLGCVLGAALPMAIAGLFALNLPPALLALIGMVAMIRLGWVDDNVANDLVDAKALPGSYVNSVKRRQVWAWRLFGLRPGLDPNQIDPALLATRYRAEAQVLQVALLTGLAVAAGLLLPLAMGLPFLALMLGFAWLHMDRLYLSLVALDRGTPVPRHILMSRVRWAASWLPEDR